MMQPISSNPYLVPQQTGYVPMSQQPSYNAVKIDVHNPSLTAGSQGLPVAQAPQAQYAPVTNPYYNYPQAQLYDYPQAPQNVQPYYMPQNVAMNQPPVYQMPQPQPVVYPTVMPATMPQVPGAALNNALNQANAAEQIAAATLNALNQAPQIQQQNINAPQVNVPEPVITKPQDASVAPAATPEVVAPTTVAPQIDLNGFISRLANPDYEVQAAAMEEIANMVKDEPQKATELLDEKVVSALANIMNADSSKLAGPTAEQIAARQKLLAGQQMTEAEQQLANTITPMEQAERNKSYAMFTTSIMQKLFGEEVEKLANTTVPLTELPGAVNIVQHLKDNPNPMVRTSAIESLSYIQRPEYKEDLKTIFEIAQNDQDKNVQDAAKIALEKLNNMQVAKTVEMKPQTQAQAA